MPGRGRVTAESGFTLLEMLVALTVLGFLMTALWQGVRTGVDFWHAQLRRTAETAELDSATRVLRAILTTVPIEPAALAAPVAIGFRGRADALGLVGELPNGFGGARLVDMMIALRGGRIVIAWMPYHREQAQPPPNPTVNELIGNAQRVEFSYWGSPLPGTPAAWLDKWDGPALPDLVRIRVGFSAGDRRRWPDLIIAPQL